MKFSAPYSGVCMEFGNSRAKFWHHNVEFHYQIVEFFFLTLTPFSGVLLEFCLSVKNIEIIIYRKSAIL